MDTPDLHSELESLDELHNPFIVVLDFIFALTGGNLGNFTKKGTQWVYEPNFVTFSIHSQRARNVTICLRGNPHEFAQYEHLPLASAQHGYCRCKVESVLQLDAALVYIRRAHELRSKGRHRDQKEQRIVEV